MTAYSTNIATMQTVMQTASGALEKLFGLDRVVVELATAGLIDVAVQTAAPTATRLWFDTNTQPGILKYHTGTAWAPVTSPVHFFKHIHNNGFNNYTATVAPSTGNDSTQGYAPGSMWLDVTGGKVYFCRSAAAGAATWIDASGGGAVTDNANGTYSAGATTIYGAQINEYTAETVIAADDYLLIYDTSAGGLRKISRSDFLANWQYKNNTSAIVPPTATDDSAAGYSVGSMWIDTVGDEAYRCVDASAGSAVWINTTVTVGDELGSMALQAATAVDIDGGNIDGVVIGAVTPAAISGTTGSFSGQVTSGGVNVVDQNRQISTAAASGLSGGGNLSANRSLALDVNGMTSITPAAADTLPLYDASGAVHGKATAAQIAGIAPAFSQINVPNGTAPQASAGGEALTLTNATGIVITGNSGTDAIDIAFSVDAISSAMAAGEPTGGDLLAIWDASSSSMKKVSLTNLVGQSTVV